MREKEQTRRRFLQVAGIGTAASLAGANGCFGTQGQPSTGEERGRFEIQNPKFEIGKKRRFELGLASYTLR